MNNFELFCAAWEKNMAICIAKNPSDYMPGSNATAIVAKMRPALKDGSFNKNSQSVKMTCKELKIPHTYKDIAVYIKF